MTDTPDEQEPGTDLAKWADEAMFEAAPIRGKGPQVHLLWATPDPLGAIAAACRMYEGKPTYNTHDISDDERRHYWEQVQKTHLKAPLEFVKLHFFIEGVTRAFTHQMVRQRTAVYAQESLRFAVKTNMADEVELPPSIPLGSREAELWAEAVEDVSQSYTMLVDAGVPAEDARGLLPHAVKTRLNYCTDLRALLDHAGNRLCTQAQFEWRAVFIGIVQAIHNHVGFAPDEYSVRTEREYWEGGIGDAPYKVADLADTATGRSTGWQFRHIAESQVFKPVCFALGHCPFTATFDRQCTIRERVQAGKFDEIQPAEYMADPTAGRRD